MYCGNNGMYPGLRDGSLTLGTRYKCLRRGIGIGLNLPVDPTYRNEYLPIDKTKIYCGNERTLPSGYDMFGNLPQCQSKGVSVGKKIKANKKKK